MTLREYLILRGPEMRALKSIVLVILLSCFLIAQLCKAQLADKTPAQSRFDYHMHVISTGNAYQRVQAIPILAGIDDSRVVPALMDLLKDEDRGVRTYAAHQLARLADKRSADALASALTDPWGNVRMYAAEGLAKIGGDKHVPELVAAVINSLPDTHQLEFRTWSLVAMLESLGKLCSKAPPEILALLTRIRADQQISQDWWRFYAAVARCLGQIGDKAAYDQLQQVRKALEANYQNYGTWYAVRKALAAIDPDNMPFNRQAADILNRARPGMISDEYRHATWVQPLVRLGTQAIPDIEWALRFEDEQNNERVRVAAEALGQIGGAEAAKVLRQYIERQLSQNGETRATKTQEYTVAMERLSSQQAQTRLARRRGYPVRMAMVALLQAEPQRQTVKEVLSLLPALNDFDQEYFVRSTFHAKPETIPQETRVFLYSSIVLVQRKQSPFGSYAPSAAAKFLGQIGGEEAGRALSEALLKSEDARVREATARALGGIKGYDAIPILVKASTLADPPIGAIAEAMAAIGDKRALPALENLQSREPLRQADRICIAAALARLGRNYERNAAIVREALPDSLELAQWLHDTKTIKAVAAFVEDQQEHTRQRAISTLEAMGTKEAFDALRRFIDLQRITDLQWLEQLSAAVSRMAEEVGNNSAEDYYAEVAAVSSTVRGWFVITAMAQPPPEAHDTYELVKRRAELARKVWIAEASRRLDLAAQREREIWQYDIPEQAIRAVRDIFAPELVAVLRRIVRESQAKVSFHGGDKTVEFYHLRSLAAEVLTEKTGRPYSFIDVDGRTHPGGWNPSREK
jgi:HEAT repeat protein